MRQLLLLLVLLSLLTLPAGCAINVGNSLPAGALHSPDPSSASYWSSDDYGYQHDAEYNVPEEAEQQVLRKPAPVILAAEFLIDAFDEGHAVAAVTEKRRAKDRLFSEFLGKSAVRPAVYNSSSAAFDKQQTAQQDATSEIRQASVNPIASTSIEKTTSRSHRAMIASAPKRAFISPLLCLTLLVLAFGGATWRWLDRVDQHILLAVRHENSIEPPANQPPANQPPANQLYANQPSAERLNDGEVCKSLIVAACTPSQSKPREIIKPPCRSLIQVRQRIIQQRHPLALTYDETSGQTETDLARAETLTTLALTGLPAPPPANRALAIVAPNHTVQKKIALRLPPRRLTSPKLEAPKLDGQNSCGQVILASPPCRALSVNRPTNRSLALLKIAHAPSLPAISNRQQEPMRTTISLGGRSINYRGKLEYSL